MTTLFHNFDADGYYTGSAPAPINPVTGKVGDINPDVATTDPLPNYLPEKERCRRVDGVWVVEQVPQPELQPEPEPQPPQFPVFFGNAKLDLFTPDEQLAVVTAAMSDPVVKLMYDRLRNAAYLTYEDPEAERGLALLADKGLLTAQRKAEIVLAMQPK